MRRLGILLGACGAIFGGCLAYSDARASWDNYAAHRKFQSLMASPTMQKVAKAARAYLKPDQFGGIPVVESQVRMNADGTIGAGSIPDFDQFKAAYNTKTITQSRSKFVPPPPIPDDQRGDLRGLLVSVDLDGIKEVTVDKDGLVSSIQPSTGGSVQRVDSPPLQAYLIPVIYPVFGFLIPWGCIRVLTWVVSGFFAEVPR